MKVLIISNMYPSNGDPVYGTFVKVFTESVRKLNSEGTTKLVTIKGRSKMPVKLWKYLSFYLREFAALAFRRYDIVYVHTITFPILPIKIVSLFRRLPLIFNTHGTDLLGTARSTQLLRRLARHTVGKALAIVSPSEYFKEHIKEFLPDYPSEKIFVSPSGGVDTSLFRPSPKEETGITTIGYVSRIDHGKGWDLFIEAIANLTKDGYKIKAIMAGRGSEEPLLKDAIKHYDLEKTISYIGPVAHDRLPEIYSSFDVFVFPSTESESLGLVGIEAMACGVPVIGSDFAGPKCYIADGVNGYLFRKGDTTDLTLTLKKYLDSTPEEKALLANGARRTAENYDTQAVMSALFRFIKDISTNNND